MGLSINDTAPDVVGVAYLRTNYLPIITEGDINQAVREEIVHITEISC